MRPDVVFRIAKDGMLRFVPKVVWRSLPMALVACLSGALETGAQPPGPPSLRVGQAAVNITPPIGAPMTGYYSVRKAEGVHDDLMARALVLEQAGTRVALVACDLVGVERQTVEAARRRIMQHTGIPPEAVMISATHSHTGPLMRSRFLEAVAAREAAEPNGGEAQRLAAQYLELLPLKIADSVRIAASRLAPARAGFGAGREESLVFYRRFLMKDGSVRTNPGKLNPDIVRPAGTPDPDVLVVYFERDDGSPLATYVNYALHLDTVGGTYYSADFPYTLGRLLGRAKSSPMLTLFTIGAAGNINHVDVSSKAPQKGHQEAERIGTVLAGEVLKTYMRLRPVEAAPGQQALLRARSEVVRLELPSFSPEEVAAARKTAAQFGQPKQVFLDMVRAFKILDVAAREGRPLEAEVQVIALGTQVAWVGLPGEVFVELGRAIKQASPFPQTIIVGLANGSISYITHRKGFEEGAYEATSARFAPGGGEKLVDAALRLLRAIH